MIILFIIWWILWYGLAQSYNFQKIKFDQRWWHYITQTFYNTNSWFKSLFLPKSSSYTNVVYCRQAQWVGMGKVKDPVLTLTWAWYILIDDNLYLDGDPIE